MFSTGNRIHKFIICLTIILSLALFPLNAVHAATETDNSGNASDYSFDTMASTVAAALSTTYADPTDASSSLTKRYGHVKPGTAGGLLAYTDKNNSNAVWGLFMQTLAMGSNTNSYKSLSGGLASNIGANNVFSNYVCTGAVLADMGIDSTDSDVSSVGMFNSRSIVGGITLIAFILSQAVTVIFGFTIALLKLLNPFGVFANVTAGASFNSHIRDLASGTIFSSAGAGGIVGGSITTFVGTLYDWLYDFGYILMAVLFGIMLIKFIMPGSRNRLSGLKKWIIQALFIMGGVAILGGTYTTVLNMLSDTTTGGNTAAAKMVASTFCDFENWAYTGFAKPASMPSIKVKVSSGTITSDGNDVQSICYSINKKTTEALGIAGLPSSLGTSGSGVSATVADMQTAVNTTDSGSNDTTQWVIDMLLRYMSGKKIYSSSYESAWKAKNWASPAAATALSSMFKELFPSSSVFNQALEDDTNYKNLVFGDSIKTLEPAGADHKKAINPFAAGTGSTIVMQQNDAGGATPVTNINLDANGTSTFNIGGWSAMSVYNYLNTTFDSSSLTTYSASTSASNYVRDSHYSVNLVGKGVESTVFLMVCLTMLLTYTFLGFFYGFGILMTNLKRGIRLITSTAGAMLGSVSAIARVISYTVLMIAEIILNMLLYVLTTELLYEIAVKLSAEVTTRITTVFPGVTVIVQPVAGIVIVIFLLWFTRESMKLRKPIITSMEEAADDIIKKFIVGTSGTAVATAGASGGAGGKSAGAGAGAGAAAGAHKPASGLEGLISPQYAALKNASAAHHARKAKDEAEGNKTAADLGIVGGSDSAVTDERNENNYQAARRKAKADAAKQKLNGGMYALEGTAEAAAGAVSGNPALVAKGASDVSKGTSAVSSADINKDNNLAAAANSNAKANGGEESIAAAMAPSNNTEVKDFNATNEAASTAKAVVVGDMVGDINADGGIASELSKGESVTKDIDMTENVNKASSTKQIGMSGETSKSDYDSVGDQSMARTLGTANNSSGNSSVKSLGGSSGSGSSSVSYSGKSLGGAPENADTRSVSGQIGSRPVHNTSSVPSGNNGGGSAGVINAKAHNTQNTIAGNASKLIVEDEVTVERKTVVKDAGNAGHATAFAGGTAPKNMSQTVQEKVEIRHERETNHSYTESGFSGSAGTVAAKGSVSSRTVSDIVNIKHDTDVRDDNTDNNKNDNKNNGDDTV